MLKLMGKKKLTFYAQNVCLSRTMLPDLIMSRVYMPKCFVFILQGSYREV